MGRTPPECFGRATRPAPAKPVLVPANSLHYSSELVKGANSTPIASRVVQVLDSKAGGPGAVSAGNPRNAWMTFSMSSMQGGDRELIQGRYHWRQPHLGEAIAKPQPPGKSFLVKPLTGQVNGKLLPLLLRELPGWLPSTRLRLAQRAARSREGRTKQPWAA